MVRERLRLCRRGRGIRLLGLDRPQYVVIDEQMRDTQRLDPFGEGLDVVRSCQSRMREHCP